MGNLESKLTPYYEIVNEDTSNNTSPSGKSFQDYNFNPNNLSIWSIKRANVNNSQNKNATLFEFVNHNGKNSDSNRNKQNLKLALNQIKIIKTVRHPNIVKYLYSEEPSTPSSLNQNLKCLLITESIRPLNNLIETLNKEQIIRGLYCITNSLAFLHEKLKISHNNINKSCIYSNSKQIWKLSDFELSISFNDLNKESLRQIFDLKCKSSITPEEEAAFGNIENNRYDLDFILKQYSHSIDAYGWSFLMIDILFNKDKNSSYSANKKLMKTNSTMNMIDDIDGDYDEDYDDESLKDLELYLNKDPKLRPNMNEALNLKLFDLYRDSSTNNSSNFSESNNNDSSNDIKDLCNQSNFDPFKLTNLNDLENNLVKLIDYLNELVKSENEPKKSTKTSPNLQLNEKLIDFLLSPFMFFSENVTNKIFPSLFIPKEEYSKFKNNSLNMIYYHNCLNNLNIYQEENSVNILKPFIDLDKYKAIVLPRILNLFSMRSMQIRIVLLEYFPFYIHYINDVDTLRYEILPELLVGLKDLNDKLVSLTFSCLSVMVQLLGSEIVVGKNENNNKQKYFSDNIPKTVVHINSDHNSSNSINKITSINSNNKIIVNKNEISKIATKISLTTSLDEDNMLSFLSKNDELINKNKVFSDSMIGLHDENESSASSTSTSTSVKINTGKTAVFDVFSTDTNNTNTNNEDDVDYDEWSNDFGWSSKTTTSFETAQQLNGGINNNKLDDFNANQTAASLLSLADSEIVQMDQIKFEQSSKNSDQNNTLKTTSFITKNSFDSYDIKNINIIKKETNSGDDLIESFLNDMQPIIKAKKDNLFEMTKLNNASTKSLSSNLSYTPSNNNANDLKNGSGDAQNLWECEESIDLD